MTLFRPVTILAACFCATAALAQTSAPFQQFNIGRPTQQEAIGSGNDALKMLGVQPPSDPMKRLEAPRGNQPTAQGGAATTAAPAATASNECRARVHITNWQWTQDGRHPVALSFTVETDRAERSRALAIDFAFEYRGADQSGAPLSEPAKSYISTEILRLAAGDNPTRRTLETGPSLVGRTIMDRILVGAVACRAE